MKVGQTNWDGMFLSLIEMCKRPEIIDALEPYYDALKKEKKLTEHYSNLYEKAVENVKHLETKSSMSEEEHYEWEGAVGWFETIGEEIGFREESLATGLIISLWKPVNHLSLTTYHGLNSRSIKLPHNKFDVFRIGPKIGSEYWAHSLNAASNYVRHSDEWYKNLAKYMRDGTGNWRVDIPDIDESKNFINTKKNLEILENIGLEVDFLISSNEMSHCIAEKLGILDKSNAENIYLEWTEEVHKFVKTKLGR